MNARRILLPSLLLLALLPCHKDNGLEAQSATPGWLLARIDSMASNRYYTGTRVYRYTWNGQYVYYISIPVSSCAYCEVYKYNGAKVKFASDAEFMDFINRKADPVLIWEWPLELNSRPPTSARMPFVWSDSSNPEVFRGLLRQKDDTL